MAGCGSKEATEQATSSPTTSTASAGAGSLPPDLDQGPRAAATGADEAKAKIGEGLFQTKGCSACHGFGKRVSCPDLLGVSQRRTAKWMESQILHPDVMTKQDPIARQLFAQYSLQMPKQGLTEDEARAVIEFLKHKDHEAGEKSETK
jgi:mono/diheme cytochrome c family protein